VRRAAVLVTLAFTACATVPPSALERVQVECGGKALVYSNADKFDKKVTVNATDRCSGADSEVQLADANGTVVDRFAVPDGTTKTIAVTLKPDYTLNFVCAGKEGGCMYVVSTE
jgi:hypothetical protein